MRKIVDLLKFIVLCGLLLHMMEGCTKPQPSGPPPSNIVSGPSVQQQHLIEYRIYNSVSTVERWWTADQQVQQHDTVWNANSTISFVSSPSNPSPLIRTCTASNNSSVDSVRVEIWVDGVIRASHTDVVQSTTTYYY